MPKISIPSYNTKVTFPDDMPQDQINSELARLFPPKPETQPVGLLDAVKQVASDSGSGFVKGLKSGALAKGGVPFFQEPVFQTYPSNTPPLAAPTPEEVAAANQERISKLYETKLSPEEEGRFQQWKAQYAPSDSGWDYDLRGAFKAGLKPGANGHWDDKFKKPNHPTFSVFSNYASARPDLAGTWNGENYTPSAGKADFLKEQAAAEGYWDSRPKPQDPGIIAGTAESIGSIVGKLPEMAVGAAAGSLAGPVGTVVGGTASMGGITEYANPNATPMSVLKATGTGAVEGALMEVGGVAGGKLLGGAASRLMGAGEQVAAYETAQKAAADALKAFRAAPTTETKTAAVAAQKAAEAAYTAIPITVRAAQAGGKFTGSTLGMGSAPLAHLQMPTIKNYEDAFALTATLHAFGGIKAVREIGRAHV